LAGLDVARAVAIYGMLLAHFAYEARSEPGWLGSVARFTDGRAMPLFVVLGGVGITLLTQAARHPDRALLGRAALLFVAGLLLENRTNVLVILHVYAVLFVLAVVLRRLPGGVLLGLAAVATVGGGAIQLAEVDWTNVRSELVDSSTTWGIVPILARPGVLAVDLVATGGYPLFPTLAFATVGMWLGRQRLTGMGRQLAVAGAGVALFVAGYGGWQLVETARTDLVVVDGESASIRIDPAHAERLTEATGESVTDLRRRARTALADGVDPEEIDAELTALGIPASDLSNLADGNGHSHQPAWVVGATGFALAVIGVSLLATRAFGAALVPLASAGRMALTFYIGHLLILMAVADTWPGTRTAGETIALLSLAFAGFALLATAWLAVLPQGPAEALLRLAGGGGLRRHSPQPATVPAHATLTQHGPTAGAWPVGDPAAGPAASPAAGAHPGRFHPGTSGIGTGGWGPAPPQPSRSAPASHAPGKLNGWPAVPPVAGGTAAAAPPHQPAPDAPWPTRPPAHPPQA
jgi:uncharacterized membrane protein